MHRAQGIGDGALGVLAHFLDRLQGDLQVAHIVHGIEHPEHVDTVAGSPLHELRHHIIGVVAVTENILTPKQHLLGGIRHGFFQLPNTLPGIFTQIANTGVEGCPAPGFQRPEADLVQPGGDWQHIVQAHAGRQ